MKKLTAGIFATLLTVVTVGVANADIASTAWVNSKIGEVNTGVDNKIEGVQQTVNSQATEIAELDEQVLGLASEVENKLDTATASQTYATKAALDSKLNKNLGTGSSGNILTVGSDGAITSSATIAQGKVNGLTAALNAKADASDLTTLETEVGKKLDSTTASNTYATKTELEDYATTEELTSGLANKLDSTTASNTYATKTALNAKADASALTALETEVEDKQDKLSEAQLNAVNSGITEAKVSTYDGYNSKITTATNTANTAKTAADAATEAANAAKTAADVRRRACRRLSAS